MSKVRCEASRLDPNLLEPPPRSVAFAEKIRNFLSIPAYGVDPPDPPPEAQRLINLAHHVKLRNHYITFYHRFYFGYDV